MGNIIDTFPCTLTAADIEKLTKSTVFNPVEDAMLFRDSALLDRIFQVFDADRNDLIDFNEYILCLSTVSNKASPEAKLELSFKIYDFDGDGMINTKDLSTVVAATMKEQDIVIHKGDVDQIVEQTMKEANPSKPGYISYAEYLTLVANRPYLLLHLTLNITNIIAEYINKTGYAFKTPRP